jgi:hypothetical protein
VGSFADEIKEATRLLPAFNAALRGAGRGGSAGGLAGAPGGGGGGALGSVLGGVMGKGGGFAAAAGPAGLAIAGASMAFDAAAAGARFMTPAASAYAVTGSSQAFGSAVTQSTIGAIQGNAFGGLILGATGVTAAADTNQRAGQSVLNTTEDLARIGVNVSDGQRQKLFDIAQEQEKRVTEERGKVAALAGSAAELRDAKPAGAGGGFDAVVSALQSIESLLRGLVGGRN